MSGHLDQSDDIWEVTALETVRTEMVKAQSVNVLDGIMRYKYAWVGRAFNSRIRKIIFRHSDDEVNTAA